MSGSLPHYLESELYERVRSEPRVFEFLAKSCLDGIWYWDLKRRDQEWMSAGFWELLGYNASEKAHLASEWQEMIFPEDLEVALANLDAHLANPDHAYDQLVRYRHRDGSTIWVRCRGIATWDAGGQPTRMLGAHNDVTALKQMEQERREAMSKAVLAQERDRRRLATNLHDGFGQLLTLAGVKLGMLRDASRQFGLEGRVREIEELIGEAQREISSLSFQLSPPVLHDVGLAAAVDWLAEDMQRRYGLHVRVEAGELLDGLGEEARITLFRAIQESLINVAKHARVREARVRLAREDACVTAAIEDSGVGFHDHEPWGFGLVSMQQSLDHLDGSLEVRSIPGEGTWLLLALPVGPKGQSA